MDTISGSTDKSEGQYRGESQYREGREGRSHLFEHQASRVSPNVFVWAAGASLVGSLVFQIIGARKQTALGHLLGVHSSTPMSNFIGLWTPTLLLMGVYSKLSKLSKQEQQRQSSGMR